MAMTIEQARKELNNIEASFNRVINQIRRSCIDVEIKRRMLEDLNDMASEVHHLVIIGDGERGDYIYYR